MTEKEELRKKIKKRIGGLSKESCLAYSLNIADKLLNLPEYLNSNSVFVYNSFGCEVMTDSIIADALKRNKTVCVPRVEGERMQAVVIDCNTEFVSNEWGILEPLSNEIFAPEAIELSLIPLVGFDRRLNRLGRGKGFYDKFLSGLPCIKIALAYSVQEENSIIVDQFDIMVDKIITEKEIIG